MFEKALAMQNGTAPASGNDDDEEEEERKLSKAEMKELQRKRIKKQDAVWQKNMAKIMKKKNNNIERSLNNEKDFHRCNSGRSKTACM